ncbi:MAG: TonB-dependent receptor [Puia sp.]
MKLTAFIIFAASLQLHAKGYSQTVTLSLKDVSLQKVFKLIQKQTGYNFLYTEEILENAGKVNMDIHDQSLAVALDKSLENSTLTYSILEGTVVIKKKPVVYDNPKAAQDVSPPMQIAGKITNEEGEPLQNVSVVLKGQPRIGTTTDANGNYSIEVPDNSSAVLVFSFVGMETQEIAVSKNKIISLSLKAAAGKEQEVVVTGYGTQKKINLTGAVATIGGDKIANRPVTNISAALQGEMAGVQVTVQSGQPGRDNGSINIRGVGTMNNPAPLVIVDGIVGSMDDINPNDIESINVLKDASAGAIYGSRAANGVILLTTKRGKLGTPKISYNGYVGKTKLTTYPRFADSYDYGVLLNEGLQNEGKAPRYTADELEKFKNGSDPVNYPNTDWMARLFQGKGMQQSHNISLSGGTESSRYLLSLGYLNQDGLIKNTDNTRYNVRFNLDSKVSDHLTIGLSSMLSRQKIDEPSGGYSQEGMGSILLQLYRVAPTFTVKSPDGLWTRFFDGNPIAYVEDGGLSTANVSHVLGNLFAEYSIVRGLKIRASAGIDYNSLDSSKHVKDITYSDGSYQGPNYVSDANVRSTRIILQSVLTYQRSFGNHNLNALMGVEREKYRLDFDNGYRQNFPSNDLTELNAGSVLGMSSAGYSDENSLGSYFGRVNYDYKGKYLLEGTLRYDGSSKFAEPRRWGTFPSFSAGWRVSQEPFMKEITAISEFKIRGSYGTLGNNAISDYQYLSLITLGQNYPFGGQIASGAAQTAASNPNLQWEKSTTTDFGFDLSLFKNKLTLTADYYNRLTDNILISVPVSAIYGLPAPVVNAGAMRNRGLEFLLGHSNRIGQFSYNASFNISFNKNEAVRFANPSISTSQIEAEGYEWNAYYGYQEVGLYKTQDQIQNAPKVSGTPVILGDIMFKDQNHDGVIDGKDRVVLGSNIPGIIYGLNLQFKYKNFDLGIFAQGAAKVKQLITYQLLFPFFNGGKALTRNLDRWTPATPNSKFPATHVDEAYNYSTASNASVINASYIRLKNLQIGYTFPQSLLRSVKVSSLRIFVSGTNLFTITKLYEGLDPESSMTQIYDGKYPNVETYTAGINLNF